MAFRPRLTRDGIANNPYYYANNPFEQSGYGLPNCTAYAWGRFWEEGEPPTRPNLSTGNAQDWYGNTADGYDRGSTPRVGAILCLSGGGGEGVGHVCIVEQINADGSIVTSNSAYTRNPDLMDSYYFYLETRQPPNYDPSGTYGFQGFIYNPYVNVTTASPYVVAAMCGNWWGESQVNPGIWESMVVKTWDYIYGTDGSNMGGYGLGQWTNTQDPYGNVSWRLRNLHDWVTSNGYQDGDGDGQLAYLPVENHWGNYPSPRLGYSSLTEFLESTSTSLSDLTYDFLYCWEGIGDSDFSRRYDFAQRCYLYILAHQNDDPSQYQWISKNEFLSEAETYNNVMVIWFWFSSGEPVPPTPIIKTSFIKYINKRKFMKRRGLIWR